MLWCSVYKPFILLHEFFYAIVNGILVFNSFLYCSLLVYRRHTIFPPFLFFKYFYWLYYYSCPISPFIPLYPAHPSHPHSPRLSSCPWVIHISSLASPFPILFLTSPYLFCTYHLCFLFPVPFPPLTPSSSPLITLHMISISVILFLF